MKAGISTACFYPDLTETVVETLCNNGVKALEIFFNCELEVSPAYTGRLKRMVDSAGAQILALHPYTSTIEPIGFFSRYMRRFEQYRDVYKFYYEAAARLGADIFVFHGGSLYQEIPPEEYFHRFGLMVEDAKSLGVRLCHENVSRNISKSPQFFAKLAAAVPNAHFVLDIKQAVRAGEAVEDFLYCMHGKLCHIHLSDHDEEQSCMLLGRGTFNIDDFLTTIGKNGYDGGLIVELYRENFDGLVEILDTYQLLCTKLLTMGKNCTKRTTLFDNK